MSLRLKLALIILLGVVTAVLAYPREDVIFKAVGLKNVHLGVRQGLDLQGGAQLTFQADLSKTSATDRTSAMQSLIQVMEKRANFGNSSGTSEIVVQQQGADRVLVQLPGVQNVTDAINRIGKTANLTFVQVTSSGQAIPTDVGGKDVQTANPDYDPQTNQPIVTLQLKGGNSTKKFAALTTQISQSGGYLTTMLDDQIIFGPATVSQPITNGQAQLSGNFKSLSDAQEIASEINAGALPVPVTLVQQETVGPSLGAISVQRSLVAGAIGLGVVALFMIAYYRLAGVLAVIALIIYTTITLTLYKLSALLPGYTIVLTLAGIAGFILSIGMAVDANVLIFERLKEELRSGKSFVAATEVAFDRAWTSIRDSNVSTLITCAILYLSSAATPIIRGFAVTLGLGVLVSLFTSVVITRTFLRLLIRTKIGKRPEFYGLPKPKAEVES
jgi:preprotein translocase subunit SecD